MKNEITEKKKRNGNGSSGNTGGSGYNFGIDF